MPQKSILSFFKSAEQNSVEETKSKCVVVEDSPVKKTRKKRKVQCIESDDESSDISNKKLNGESSKTIKASCAETEKISNKSLKKKKNEDFSSEKKLEEKKIENGKAENSTQSPSKIVQKSPNSEEKLNIEKSMDIDIPVEAKEEPSTSNGNGSTDFIPKRKTARKQMSSSRNTKKQEKEESKSETINDEVIIKEMPKSNEDVELANMDCETEQISESVSEKQETIKKDVKKSKSGEDSKKSDTKFKVNSTKKVKGSPLKKSTKKESINSFFTPMKKAEEEGSTKEISKRSLETKNDSPIKKVQKKRIQCLESDDENDESASKEVSVKEEDDESEIRNSSKSPQKNKDAKKSESTNSSKLPEEKKDANESENTASEAKNSSPKKSKNENKDNEKQKFSVKSTSAVDTVYNPSKSQYHPITDAFWKQNEKVPYLALAKTLELIEETSGRLKTIEILANFFRSVIILSPDDFLHSVYLCLNRVAPEYEGIEMGVGDTLLMKAVAQATGRTVEKIKAEVAIKGDLGLVSESSRGNQRVMFAPPKLTVSAVFNKFLEIAKMSGNSAMAKKIDKIKGLFVACRDCEAKYIIRSLSGKLRIGLAEQSILSAIARAAVITPPGQAYPPKKIDTSKGMSAESFKEFLDSQILILKTAYCECPNYDLIIPVLLKEGISALPDRCQLSPGVPLKPMLAHPTAGIDKVLERFDKNAFTCEFKYDGERAQIHMNDEGEVRIFSRNQEDNTSKYPDIISRLSSAVKESTKSFILDSEAVAWDRNLKQILPFQVLSTRKRKDAVESEIVVQVCVMAFDLLYLNGESLVKKPLKERRSLLHSSFTEVENQFMFAQYRDGDSAETMQEFLDESVKGNCEGLMVKALEVDASYEIAKRSHNWLKLKKDYLQGIGDTLDLVVIGGYYGKGKRTGNYGGFLLACYDDENEEFQSICKLGTGFKDDNLEAHTKFLKQHIIKEPRSYFRYDHSLEPDDWFDTIQVWEIKCADLSISPVHKAAIGIVDPKKGISLRFPRFIRIRDDKSPEDATNSAQIADMYQKQQQIQNTANKNASVEEDYY